MSRLGRDYLKVGYYTEIFFVERDVRYIAIKKAQGMAGEHLTKPPYGYMVNPTDKKQWIVDEEAAAGGRHFIVCAADFVADGFLCRFPVLRYKFTVLDFNIPIHSFPFLSVFVKVRSFGASIGKGYPFP